MTEQYSSNFSKIEPLPCNAIVYRALLRKYWIDEDTKAVQNTAYILRQSKNEIGLSVNIASACSPEESAAKFRKCYGVSCYAFNFLTASEQDARTAKTLQKKVGNLDA